MRNRAAQKKMPLDGASSSRVASVHSREPNTRVVELYRYFVSKIFINCSIIIKS